MLPYRIETLNQHTPWANWSLLGLTVATSLAIQLNLIPDDMVAQHFVLGEGSPFSLIGYLFAHAGILHLIGNMVFLWVFGNAVCGTVGNLAYSLLYLCLGAFAGLLHILVSGTPVVGASGAITGVVGLAVAFYPINRVEALLSLGFLTRTIRVRLWALALYWTAWDILGAWLDVDNVAYWAHLGGTAAGLGLGLALLASHTVQLTEFDNGSLLDLLLSRRPPHQILPETDVIFARQQAAARAFRAALQAEAAIEPPAQPQTKTPLRLRVGSAPACVSAGHPQNPPPSSAPLPAWSAGQPEIRLGGGKPLAALPEATTLHSPAPGLRPAANAWPDSLPGGRYFFFDGNSRHGPITRTAFLERLACAPDTSRWWYWVAGMEEWRRVTDLDTHTTATTPPTTEMPAASSGS